MMAAALFRKSLNGEGQPLLWVGRSAMISWKIFDRPVEKTPIAALTAPMMPKARIAYSNEETPLRSINMAGTRTSIY